MQQTGEDKPDTILDTADPGDDVALRYRYQHTYAALSFLLVVDGAQDVASLVCENHEDFIVKHADGLFTGVQVKTRDLKNDQLKANDAQVVKAIRKFCELDRRFPNVFRCFDFSTNHYFWTKEDDHRNLDWLTRSIKSRASLKGVRNTNPLRAFANSIIEGSDLTLEDFCSTIQKLQLNSRGETVTSIRASLIDAIGQCSFAEEYTYQKTALFADRLVSLANTASSKGLSGTLLEAYAPGASFDDAMNKLVLGGKIIELNTLEDLISEFKSTSQPLKIDGLVPVQELPRDLARMVQKLAAGQLQKVRIDNFTDFVRSFQYLQASWAQKYSAERAKELTESVLVHVLFDCGEAETKVADDSEPFAREKFEHLKTELRSRLANDPQTIAGCELEHLIGAAGVLTEQCKVWWSPKFDIPEPRDV